MSPEKRNHSLKRPPGHKVQKQRWTVKFPENVHTVCTLYLGVQSHRGGIDQARTQAERQIDHLLSERGNQPAVTETFKITAGNDMPGTKLWIAHWTDPAQFSAKLKEVDLLRIWQGLPADAGRDDIGLWCEGFTVPLDRLQTNYVRLDYHKPGLAALPRVELPPHDFTEYWGAGRDRLAASAYDEFPLPDRLTSMSRTQAVGFGQRVCGRNYDNMCHIRSGQRWEDCDAEEREAYEGDLQPTLMRGMQYLWENPEETGSIGLRMGQRVIATDKQPLRETSVIGFHRNWADMEKWSSRHPSHLEIFSASMKHGKRFGDDRKFITWQEVAILKEGEAAFEYINCDPRTGVIRWIEMQTQDLASTKVSRL
ncbi:heme-containing dehydratase protein [Aspergillus pseudodeflectus]|uniref:Heme-containing dehydratase protein n=1 Tax=Aspergillus pseudodeflectus TaxID=176178 RepID=A0ABR4JMQ0_9EURO